MTRRKGITIGKIRTSLYWWARFFGDVQAVKKGPRAIVKRFARRVVGRWTSRLLGKLFR